jgi:hypothetical protein
MRKLFYSIIAIVAIFYTVNVIYSYTRIANNALAISSRVNNYTNAVHRAATEVDRTHNIVATRRIATTDAFNTAHATLNKIKKNYADSPIFTTVIQAYSAVRTDSSGYDTDTADIVAHDAGNAKNIWKQYCANAVADPKNQTIIMDDVSAYDEDLKAKAADLKMKTAAITKVSTEEKSVALKAYVAALTAYDIAFNARTVAVEKAKAGAVHAVNYKSEFIKTLVVIDEIAESYDNALKVYVFTLNAKDHAHAADIVYAKAVDDEMQMIRYSAKMANEAHIMYIFAIVTATASMAIAVGMIIALFFAFTNERNKKTYM